MNEISIIIPSYGQQEYLPDAIESALSQTLKCEIIVIDDGSKDNSLDVARSYEKEGVKVISQVNKGLASARNTGIMNATGRYIFPLDADDMLMETCAEKILNTFKVTDADVVGPSSKCFGIGNTEIILMPEPKLSDFRVGNRLGYFSAIKRECLLECGGYSPRMTWGYEDYHLWIDLLTRGKKIVTIPEPLVLYRTKQVSMWKEAKEHHKELMEQIYKDFPNFLPS